MKILRPVPKALSRPVSILAIVLWIVQMGVLLNRNFIQASPVALAADLARYGSSAQWKGVYYRGEKIGFVVGQTVPTDDGYELQEDGQLQMTLMGATTAAKIRTLARVDKAFSLRSFSFSLDPGTGAIGVEGALDGNRLQLTVTTPSGTHTETRELPEPPMLSLNLSRRLAAEGLAAGRRLEVMVFDPATLRNAPMSIDVQGREIVRAAGRPVPAFRVRTQLAGITSTSWVTDVGEVVKEESPMGLIVLKETRERALAQAVPAQVQSDLLQAAAVVPTPERRIDEPTAVQLLRVRLEGAGVSGADLEGAGQSVSGDVFEVRDTQTAAPGPADPEAARHLSAEPFIESDDPDVAAEARRAVEAVKAAPRERAERLVRHVNSIIEKRPTLSLPSAREVLRTRVGDCNEHTALYVAMARSLGIPSRIAVGLVYLHGAFYYHAWPEVYLEGPEGRGLWLPADPTLNQFPADATHIRLARGGLDKQSVILPLLGRLKIAILDVETRPGATPILVGRPREDARPLDIPLPRRGDGGPHCWTRPAR